MIWFVDAKLLYKFYCCISICSEKHFFSMSPHLLKNATTPARMKPQHKLKRYVSIAVVVWHKFDAIQLIVLS